MPTLENYGGRLRATPHALLQPGSLDELRALVTEHAATHRRITLRAGGNSLHDQALGTDTVLDLRALPHEIVVRPSDPLGEFLAGDAPAPCATVEVSGWTTWDAILRACLRLAPPAGWDGPAGAGLWDLTGQLAATQAARFNQCRWQTRADVALSPLLPYCVVSSGWISAAGSLSGDGVNRFSKALGREADSVLFLDLMRSDGTVVRLCQPASALWVRRASLGDHRFASTQAQNDQWFNAVVGGFGLCGVILAIRYRLLPLDRTASFQRFEALLPGVVPAQARAGSALRTISGLPAACVRALRDTCLALLPVAPPPAPHTPFFELGRLGEEVPASLLTWLRPQRSPSEVFQTLVRDAPEGTRGHLPTRSDERVRSSFALILPNRRDAFAAIRGDLAIGRAPAGAERFTVWDRRFGWFTSALIGWLCIVPWLARLSEWIALRCALLPHLEKPVRADPIPEGIFFLEGHSLAQSGFRTGREPIQQSWLFPITTPPRADAPTAEQLFSDFVTELLAIGQRSWSDGKVVRFQLMDAKYVPAGHALLCSCRDAPAIMLTVTLENGHAYRAGSKRLGQPEEELARLSERYARRGVRVHLTKNLFVDRRVLDEHYREQIAAFARVRAELDPARVWASDFGDWLSLDVAAHPNAVGS